MSNSMDFEPTLQQINDSLTEQVKYLVKEKMMLIKMIFSLCDCMKEIPNEIDYARDIQFLYETVKNFYESKEELFQLPNFI
jgi:hypothetical protein